MVGSSRPGRLSRGRREDNGGGKKWVRVWGMSVCESRRLKECESMDGFPPDENCEWPSEPSVERPSKFGGMRVWIMENLALTSPLGGTTNEQSCPQRDSIFGSRSLMDW